MKNLRSNDSFFVALIAFGLSVQAAALVQPRIITYCRVQPSPSQQFPLTVYRGSSSSWTTLFNAVRDGVNLGKTMLDVAKWPLDQASSLLNSNLMIFSSLLALFNFLVDLLVKPGGSGDLLAAWVRGNSTANAPVVGRTISSAASTGASLASDLLSAARWPLDVALALLTASLAAASSLLAFFYLLVDLGVRPQGTGHLLLAWLRGAPPPM